MHGLLQDRRGHSRGGGRMLSYHAPASLADALALLAELGPSALLVAGGTDIARAPDGALLSARRMVSLRHVDELRGVTGSRSEGVRIGALTTHRAVERSPEIATYCAALTQACAAVGTVRIRNQGTIGGSLMQGDPRYDPPAMLLALDATAVIASPGGRRTVPVEQMLSMRPPADAAPQILTAVDLPPRRPSARASYVKFAPAGAAEESTVTVAATADFDVDGSCTAGRVWLGAIGATRVRLRHSEAAIAGKPLTQAAIDGAVEASKADVHGLIEEGRLGEYEQRLVAVCTRRALQGMGGPVGPKR